MQYNISKELFDAVMDIEINKLQVDEFNYIWINIDSTHLSRFDSINNFFFKCKDWANKNEYRLLNGSHNYNNQIICRIYKDFDYIEDYEEEFKSDSEQQSVFDACKWILDNKGNK